MFFFGHLQSPLAPWGCSLPAAETQQSPAAQVAVLQPRSPPVPTAKLLSLQSAGTAQEPRTPQPCRGFLPLCKEVTAKPEIILKHTQARAGVSAAAAEQHEKG